MAWDAIETLQVRGLVFLCLTLVFIIIYIFFIVHFFLIIHFIDVIWFILDVEEDADKKMMSLAQQLSHMNQLGSTLPQTTDPNRLTNPFEAIHSNSSSNSNSSHSHLPYQVNHCFSFSSLFKVLWEEANTTIAKLIFD